MTMIVWIQVTVSHSVGAGEFGPSVFSISERQGARTSGCEYHELLLTNNSLV